MRWSLFFLIMSIFQAQAISGYAQKTQLSLDFKSTSIEKVLSEIESQSEFYFLYNKNLVDVKRKVDIQVKDKQIDAILDQLFAGTDVNYRIFNRQIVLSNEGDLVTGVSSQIKRITGTVTNRNGDPVPGVTVVVKGTTIGTITDADGNYSLKDLSGNEVLQFSFVGMKSQEVAIAGRPVINISLEEETIGIEEVVAIGYGTRRRSDITGSVATVKAGELVAQPTSDLQGMLKGKVAGLYVTMNDARPGGSSNVLLRGIRSLKGGNSPLYVVDGVPLSSINELNIEDVESISVLKDATSQAIYGARASNGVILITTKRGKNTNNKVEVSYHGYCSIQNVDPNFEIFSPEEYIQLRREAYRGDRATAADGWVGTYMNDEEIFTPLEMESIAEKRYVNWTDYAFKKDVPLTKHDLSLSGGNEKTKYSASLGYYYQDGLRYSSDLDRYSGKLTLDQEISKTFKAGLSAYYTTYTQNRETNSWTDFLTFSPIAQLYDENGDLVLYPLGDGKSENPLMYEQFRDSEYKTERIILNGYLEVTPKFLPGLKYKLNASLNSRSRETDEFHTFEDPSYLTKGYARANFNNAKDYLLENIITYDKFFGEDHRLDITAMQGLENNNVTSTTATALQLGNDFFGVNSMGSALASEVGRTDTGRKMVSFMGRVNYIFRKKYLLNLAMRADGSSVFGANHKWGYFPSAAVAWNLHRESFAQSVPWINETKLRISYGQIGNQAIDPYGSLATANEAFYVSNGTPVVGYLPGASLPNPDLRWETTTTLNAGIDFGLINRRLSGSIEFYESNTTDLLVDRKVSSSLGYSNIPANLGKVRNTGVEASLTGFLVSNDQLTWSVTANFSKNKNKLIEGVLQDAATGEYIDDINNRWFIGESVNVYYSYRFDGIFQIGDDIANSAQPAARPGDVRVADVSGPEGVPDNVITTDDRVIIRRDPKWIGSFSTNLSYKGLEFSADFYTVQGVTRINDFLTEYDYGGRMDGILNGIKRNYWTPENPVNDMFRPHATNYSEYRGALSYQDASYIRLRNVTVAYYLPKKWVNAVGLSRVRLYAAGDNLWTKTDYKSYSPEIEPNDYPETKNYTFGLNINF